MFRIDVLQNHWLILALGGGLFLLFVVILAYAAFWRAPDEGGKRAATPWVLILVYAATVMFAVVFTVLMALYPPNW